MNQINFLDMGADYWLADSNQRRLDLDKQGHTGSRPESCYLIVLDTGRNLMGFFPSSSIQQ